MTRLLSLLSICGWLVLAACTPEAELGSAVAAWQARAGNEETRGAAGEGAIVSGTEVTQTAEPQTTNGTIYGLLGAPLTGKVSFAAGTMEAGTIDLYCCRAGAYDVYTYEDASCDDPESWAVERSARIADVTDRKSVV